MSQFLIPKSKTGRVNDVDAGRLILSHQLREELILPQLMSYAAILNSDVMSYTPTGVLAPSAGCLPSESIASPSINERSIQAISSCCSSSPVKKSAVP